MTTRPLLSFPKWMTSALVGLGLLFTHAPDASAQCVGPDGLSSSVCCGPATPNLPAFPNFTLPAAGLEWAACNPLPKTCITLDVATPTSTSLCTQFTADIAALDCPGATLMKGTLTLDYTRTWTETPLPGGPPMQVWRFAAKVDLEAGGPIPVGSPVPSCAVGGTEAFYYGYVDYAFDCAAGGWQQSVVLFHNCDRFVHGPGLSSVPGAFHPDRSYALVAPDTAANPFTPSIFLPGGAPVLSEAMRTVTTPTGICLSEERIGQGTFLPQLTGCACPLMPQPPQSSANFFEGFGLCGSGFKSLNLFPTAPWYHLVSTSIGHWSTGASYPGPEHASVAEGVLLYRDACAATGGATNQTFDVFYGGMTDLGYTFDPTMALAPPTLRFLDLASNYSNPITAPPALPAVGKVDVTDHLIYVNL